MTEIPTDYAMANLKPEEIDFIQKMETTPLPSTDDWDPYEQLDILRMVTNAQSDLPDLPEGFIAVAQLNERSDEAGPGDLLEVLGMPGPVILINQLPGTALIMFKGTRIPVVGMTQVKVIQRVDALTVHT